MFNRAGKQHIQKREAPAPKDVDDKKLLIAVMGATGSGKSNFIKLITGAEVTVGHNLASCTSEVEEVDVRIDEKTVSLIDTPGFDDTNKSDTDVLRLIANYLESNYQKSRRLTGVIFLHRVTDNRMGGISNKNVLMFQKLIGETALDHVICCTTMWDLQEGQEGIFASREEELKKFYWVNMLENHARVARHYNTPQSARSVIAKLVYLKPVALKIQQELVDEKKELSQTGAGIEVNKELARLAERHREELQETKEAFERMRAQDNAKMAKALADERKALERKLQEAEATRVRLDADRQEEMRLLYERIEAAERKDQEAKEALLQQIKELRVTSQAAAFGLSVQIPYNPSDALHQERTTYDTPDGEKVRGAWRLMIAKGNWPSWPVRKPFYRSYDTASPAGLEGVHEDILMYKSDAKFKPAFAWAPSGTLYDGFTKIGTISVDMSERRGRLERAQGEGGEDFWKLNFDIVISCESDEILAWYEWNDRGQDWEGPKTRIRLNR